MSDLIHNCGNCGVRMNFNPELRIFICNLCGNSFNDELNNNDGFPIGMF